MRIKSYFFLFFACCLISNNPIFAKTVWQKTTINRINLPAKASAEVSAFVGGYLFDIEGLTSPWARVEFFSSQTNVHRFSIADNKGIFRFSNTAMPLQTGDFCFLSYDADGIANNPLCFPPPPAETKTTISGIFLSPTISLNKGLFRQNETVAAKGRSFPNAQLQVFLFEQEQPWWREFIDVIIPAAFAREGPKLTVSADEKGHFSFNLPTQKSSRWRFFVGPKLKNETMTAKSNTLAFSALSWWQWILLKTLRFIYQILRRFFDLLFRWETIVTLLSASIIFIVFSLSKG